MKRTAAKRPVITRALSSTKGAIRMRDWVERNQEKREAQIKRAQVKAKKKTGDKVFLEFKNRIQKAVTAAIKNPASSPLLKRVAFHLSKGRDVGDVAIREMLPASKAAELIEIVKQEQAKKGAEGR